MFSEWLFFLVIEMRWIASLKVQMFILTVFIFYIIYVHRDVMLGAYIRINNYYVLLKNKPFVITKYFCLSLAIFFVMKFTLWFILVCNHPNFVIDYSTVANIFFKFLPLASTSFFQKTFLLTNIFESPFPFYSV